MALSCGIDPWRYLNANAVEAQIWHAIIERSQEIYVERKEQEIKAIGAQVARSVAKLLG